jgi:hypothetical protein
MRWLNVFIRESSGIGLPAQDSTRSLVGTGLGLPGYFAPCPPPCGLLLDLRKIPRQPAPRVASFVGLLKTSASSHPASEFMLTAFYHGRHTADRGSAPRGRTSHRFHRTCDAPPFRVLRNVVEQTARENCNLRRAARAPTPVQQSTCPTLAQSPRTRPSRRGSAPPNHPLAVR